MSRKWEGCVSSTVWPRLHPYLKHRVIPVEIQSSPQCINLAFLYKDVLTNLKKKKTLENLDKSLLWPLEIRSQISN